MLCPVPVNAGGGAPEGGESLEGAEGLCSPATPIRAVCPQKDFPWLPPCSKSVCGHSRAGPVPGGAAAEIGRALGGTRLVVSAPIR